MNASFQLLWTTGVIFWGMSYTWGLISSCLQRHPSFYINIFILILLHWFLASLPCLLYLHYFFCKNIVPPDSLLLIYLYHPSVWEMFRLLLNILQNSCEACVCYVYIIPPPLVISVLDYGSIIYSSCLFTMSQACSATKVCWRYRSLEEALHPAYSQIELSLQNNGLIRVFRVIIYLIHVETWWRFLFWGKGGIQSESGLFYQVWADEWV